MSSSGGLPVNCLIRVVDDEGNALPDGQTGIVMVHSDSMMLDLPPATDSRWQGWHDSGDLGVIDSGGRLRIVGRRREVIKARDGTLVFPAEVEAALMAISGVHEAAVFGHTVTDGTEHIIAAVILDAAEERFAERAKPLLLSALGQNRLPSRIFELDSLPRVASQKIDRSALRRSLGKRLEDL
ncbi:MAG: long-chain fatty acid--CoA ligase [Sphingopyxis sp.]|nr:long-chain fatty acid--CoA ligase [Sphingopyxis sp.]